MTKQEKTNEDDNIEFKETNDGPNEEGTRWKTAQKKYC
jgi:hypothetical protein